jgi:hypothetical protein
MPYVGAPYRAKDSKQNSPGSKALPNSVQSRVEIRDMLKCVNRVSHRESRSQLKRRRVLRNRRKVRTLILPCISIEPIDCCAI